MSSKTKSRANQLTANVLRLASSQGCSVWRSNTMGVFDITVATTKLWNLCQQMRLTTKEIKQALQSCFRKSHEQIGTSDIIGYSKTGKFIAVEIKGSGDKLSLEQEQFLNDVAMKNGAAFVVAQEPDKIKFKVLGAELRVIVCSDLDFLPLLRKKLSE